MLNEDLHVNFHSIFVRSYENLKKKEQKTGKDKGKSSDSDEAMSPIAFEISSNASKFAAFSAIRSLVLEHETKYNTLSKIESRTKSFEHQLRSRSEDEANESRVIDMMSKTDSKINVPHIVSAGIQTLFDIIYETKHKHPAICSKALTSLFDIFQGHDPESFKSEPDALFQSLYELLLDLAIWNGTSPQKTSEIDERKNWSAISCSVLLALCVARGDTGKIIKAITSILMSNHTMLTQTIKLPEILIKLQKSVECAALGRPEKPTFFELGIPQNSFLDEFFVKNISFEPNSSSSVASDGKFLYILLGKSLFKVGSGYNATTKGLVYKMNKEFTKDKRGWIGFCRDKLYYKKISKRSNDNFAVIDREALIFQSPLQISTKAFKKDSMNYTLYSDGDSINAIFSAAKDDNFIIKEIISNNDFSFDLTLNLAKRSFRTYGYTPFEEEILNHPQLQKIQSSFNSFVPTLPDDSEVNEIVAGKEFGLVRTSNNKVFYYGKGASLGLKSLIKSPSLKLSELTISKVSKIVQTSLGHDGLHTLLLSDDGSVFFAGAVRRGEDGEISKRRLLKPTKPKRISRLDNHFIVHVSCNNGTSAFVTKAGKLVMFGKDTSFCDSHGIVSQLHDQHIVKVAMGKAHTVALNSKGQIFSFGVNNKGQSGRSFTSKDKTSNDDFYATKQEKSLQLHSILCDIDEHEIADEHCKICKVCFECTGYGKLCAGATKIAMKSRIPGSNCFCGHGNSGCVKCGACTSCISKQENDINNDLVPGSPDKRAKKEVKINIDEMNFANESERVAPLAPAKVTIPSSSPIIQVSCGLHHTVLLTAAGEVFTFGSNQYGQLGTGDLQPVSAPNQVKIGGVVASQVAAGSNHTVILSSKGLVFTFGNYHKGQLGRMPADASQPSHSSMQNSVTSINNDPFANLNDLYTAENPSNIMAQRQRFLWNCIPAPITSIGSNYRKKACWISASGDQTFLKIDESLVNASSLAKISVAANKNTIIFISNNEGIPGCITINKQDGKCRTHTINQYSFNLNNDLNSDDSNSEALNFSSGSDKMLKESGDLNSSSSSPSSSISSVSNTVFTIDPLYDVLWCFDVINRKVLCFNILACNTQGQATIFKSDVTLPNKNVNITRGHACLNILACLDTLAFAQNSLDTCFEVETKTKGNKNLLEMKDCKESRKICRFDAFGGGWGYFGHSVEAVRFMCDTDILMEGIGMYGGRGEYTCKIKIFDLGFDGGGFEKDGTLIFEVDDVPYFCPARTIHNIMFQKPVNVVAGKWYLLWVKVSGPSSDCGSSGKNIVVGDDQVVFTFKSSNKHSNNGTDINSGQVPTILYRVVARDRKISDNSNNEKVCTISKSFINTISPESFENLVKLLSWSWTQFKIKTNEMVEEMSSSDELLLNRFVYTCQVCLRLLKKYINEIYPSDSFKFNESDKSMATRSCQQNEILKSSQLAATNISLISESSHQAFRKSNVEKIQLAESIGNVRALLIQILCDDLSIINGKKTSTLTYSILDECNNTFVSCFNAFYPTSYLKWDCLCDLLSQMDKGVLHSRLLSGVLAGLCDPTVNLKSTFSILSPYTEQKSITSPSDNSGFPILQSADNYHYPILVEQMMYRMQKERVSTAYSTWNFKEVLTRLLDIISRPVKQRIETIYSSAKIDQNTIGEHLQNHSSYNLISNCCFLLSKILAEIVYQSCTADTDTTVISPYALQSTGIRFKKCDYSKTWNTGHFASDAICFTVDRPGIVLAGCCVYYGSGVYEYQMELLHDTLDSKSQLQHKWETVETSFGTFDQENVHRNMVQLKFERPLPLRENVCYALRFCSQGARTCSGDAGYQSVRGPCGTIFRFYPCDLSFNGTTPLRGQIPCLLYYSVPISSQCNKLKNTKEIFARDIALEFASDIVHRSRELLILARNAYLYALSSSDKSSSNSSNATQAFDSEHNITPIEEHFDISWINQPVANPSPTAKSTSFHSYYGSAPPPTTSKDPNINMTKDITKRIETFSRGIMETLKLDKKFDKNTMDCIEVDNAAEITANDFVDESASSRKSVPEVRGSAKKQQMAKSDSEESFIEREKFYEIFSTKESSLFHTLLPLTVAHISRLICSDPKVSVEILNLVKLILPHVSSWNQICNKNHASPVHQSEKSQTLQSYDLCTTSNFYAILESDHPYKSSYIYSYKVEFPSTVQWMSLEFDPQCGTAQPEDCLKILIPSVRESANDEATRMKILKTHSTNDKDSRTCSEQIMIKKFNTENGWSTNAIIVPGNEITLSLETASNYLADHKLNRYGFKCILIGYENIDSSKSFINSLINLESEFTYLGGMCSANLMRKDLVFSDEKSDDFWATENTLKKHSVLLSKGLSIQNETLTMNNILDRYDIAIDSEQSHEKQFLKDFVFVNPDSAGGRLASWIQPESRLDPNRCELKLFQDPIQSGWPSKLVIETRDQYGEIVYVPNIKIQLKVALSSSISNEKRYNKMFGKDQGVLMPLGKVNYEPVVKEKEKICIKSITAMKNFMQYSFEELRLYTPVQSKTSDLMTAKDSGDQSYSLQWTPETSGNYIINIIIDGVQINENYNVTVINANIPPPIKEHALKKIQPQYKFRKYHADFTSGLRIRLHPTLQADQIGVIKVNEVISFIDELENSDGVWVKLSTDSIRKFCSSSWYPSEAWCLAYNKHFEKRLLFSLIESKNESTTHPTDDMNNVKFFDGSFSEPSSDLQITGNFEDFKTLDDDDKKPPTFDETLESQVEKTNQSNITAAIAGVVEGGAHKLQAFQKWLKRDSIGDTTATIRKRIGSIPEVYNNNTLDLKNLNTDNVGADKLSNDINLTSPVQDSFIPASKISKVSENKMHSIKTTNPFQKSHNVGSHVKNHEYEVLNTPKQALSPSIAETIRAIFAAFLWHEGLVHDAIACASFLKFHPSILKYNIYGMDQTIVEQSHEVLTKEEKIKQRHSVEIANTGNYLNARPSTLEALTKSGYCCVHYRKQRGKHSDYRSTDDISNHVCPPALKCLVFVWDELNKDFQTFVSKILSNKDNKEASSALKTNANDLNDTENSKTKSKPRKFIDEGNSSSGAIGGSNENTVWCELCDVDIVSGSNHSPYQQNTFTQHLKINHSGCGESAKGKGYNSNGVYCEGWAGQCGEEGVGATSWYLLCEPCRDKYIVLNKKTINVNESQVNRMIVQDPKILATINPSTFTKKSKFNYNTSMEFFETMKENALFLLELNSHNGGLMNKPTGGILMPLSSKINARHSSADFVVQPNTSNYSQRFSATIHDESPRRSSLPKQNSLPKYYSGKKIPVSSDESLAPELLWTPPESITCLEMLNNRSSGSDSYRVFSMDNFHDAPVTGSQQNQPHEAGLNESKFHRSFSMIQGWGFYTNNSMNRTVTTHECTSGFNQIRQNNENTVVMRRKKTCLCDSGSNEASLLNFPSKNLKKLVPDHVLNPSFKSFSEVSSSHDIEKDMENTLEMKQFAENTFLDLLNQHQNTEDTAKASSFLNRPTINFIFEKHDLEKLRYLLRKNLRKAICSVYGLQALNWLLRTVTQTVSVHDSLWWFISSLVQTRNENDNALKLEDSDVSYEHPVVILNVDDQVQNLLSQNLHMLLQSIADITLSLPSGSALQRLAIQCFGIKFRPNDHQFLHNSHVFGNISKILSKSEEFNEENLLFSAALLESNEVDLEGVNVKNLKDKMFVEVFNNVDITDVFELIISSRQAMVSALTDNSTETFWESDDEDRNKPKIIEISMIKPHYVCKSINIHIDNCRDLAHKVTNFTVFSGSSLGELNLLETVETESNIGTWYSVPVREETNTHFRVELRGVENNIRIRQLKILGYSSDVKINQELNSFAKKNTNAHRIQQKYCELETLRVFRVLTNQVFGKLITSQDRSFTNLAQSMAESHAESPGVDSLDLREHMVGILFSRSKLTHLQKQIIVHIVHSIQKEAHKSREEWELNVREGSLSNIIKSSLSTSEVQIPKSNDVYCFEMLSMVLALSGSSVGRSYLSHQIELIKDLFVLLHTGSERVQRQVTLLLRRILPEISPETLCNILEIQYQPHKDINHLLQNPKPLSQSSIGIIDILLAIIAKSLQIQVKFKNGSNPLNNKNLTVKLCDNIMPPPAVSSLTVTQKVAPIYQHQISSGTDIGSNISGSSRECETIDKNLLSFKEDPRKRWFLCGTASTKLAGNIISLIKDMISGKLSEKWSNITKTAVAECIVNLAHLEEANRQPETCLKTSTVWLALASLCVLNEDHVVKLSSGQWSKTGGDKRPLCNNHDDSFTNAVIECTECGTLCCDCDRFLHLNRKTWNHHRTVCKEEEESIKVELHESCGRIKLFWLLGLADSKTLKGIIEFRDGHSVIICDPQNAIGRCRFCGVYGNSGLLAVGNVCVEQQCQEYSANACSKILACGHFCGGIMNESPECLPCLHQKCQSVSNFDERKPKLTQDGDDMCMICFSEALSCAPSIQMLCGHIFHYHCSRLILQKRWNGAKISFAFSQCPICKSDIYHDSLVDLLEPINALKDDVKKKAVMRFKYEATNRDGIDDHKDLTVYAMERYAYYVCCKCQKAYYGGEARCDIELGENFNPEELICGGCSDIAKAQMCPKHGIDFLEYKCKFCCSIAVFFCFGTTHFCDTCHDDFQRLTNIPKIKLPKCPAGPKASQLMGDECPLHIVHPPTGEEFALGCGICRNFHTF